MKAMKQVYGMKCLVAVKRVVDPYVCIRVKAEQSQIDVDNLKMSMNPFDEIAVEEAVRLKEAGIISEIIAISIGPKTSQETLRQALALGADKAVLIENNYNLQPLVIAKLIKIFVEEEKPKLILMGKQAIDKDCNQTGQMLSALLGWSQGTFVSRISITKAEVTIDREIDDGVETLILKLPAVLTVDLRLNKPRYIALQNVMKAKRKLLEIRQSEDMSISLNTSLKIIQIKPPTERKPGIRLSSVSELVNKLKTEAKVL